MADFMQKYQSRIRLAENYYAKNHGGEAMNSNMKIVLGKCLDNTMNYLNEAYDPATATQRGDMKDYKKFCIALTNLAIPNLIAPELVHTMPMTSFVGNIAYAKYTKSIDKGATRAGDVFNDPWKFGKVDTTYTGSAVVENVANGESIAPVFTPVLSSFLNEADSTRYQLKVTQPDGTFITYANLDGDGVYKNTTGGDVKVAYMYDNMVIPQNALPTINVEMDNIVLQAKARRIAIRYSQMAAFQAKQDYGMDMDTELAKQAVAELQYEIDTEITKMLSDATSVDNGLVWSRTLPVGVKVELQAA